jgi:hypothetical protein
MDYGTDILQEKLLNSVLELGNYSGITIVLQEHIHAETALLYKILIKNIHGSMFPQSKFRFLLE